MVQFRHPPKKTSPIWELPEFQILYTVSFNLNVWISSGVDRQEVSFLLLVWLLSPVPPQPLHIVVCVSVCSLARCSPLCGRDPEPETNIFQASLSASSRHNFMFLQWDELSWDLEDFLWLWTQLGSWSSPGEDFVAGVRILRFSVAAELCNQHVPASGDSSHAL